MVKNLFVIAALFSSQFVLAENMPEHPGRQTLEQSLKPKSYDEVFSELYKKNRLEKMSSCLGVSVELFEEKLRAAYTSCNTGQNHLAVLVCFGEEYPKHSNISIEKYKQCTEQVGQDEISQQKDHPLAKLAALKSQYKTLYKRRDVLIDKDDLSDAEDNEMDELTDKISELEVEIMEMDESFEPHDD